MEYRNKITRAETRVLSKGLVEATVSTEAKDRDGDIIRVRGWDLTSFLTYPVLISSHNYGSLKSIIGHWESMEVKGKKLVGTAQYYIGKGNEEADWGFQLAEMGRAAYSVGFKPDMSKAKELESNDPWFSNFEFNGQELLEVSQVTIPSNPEALQRAKGLKLHPVIDAIIGEALGSSITKSVHGEHDHDENGRHDHDEDKAAIIETLMTELDGKLMAKLTLDIQTLIRQEMDCLRAEKRPTEDYLAIARLAKEQVRRGY